MNKGWLAAVGAMLTLWVIVLGAPWFGSRIAASRIPDPDSAEMRAEVARVAGLAAREDFPKGANCAVKVLRVEAATTWAWAHCVGWQSSNDGYLEAGWSSPIRVDGQVVVRPEDGANNGSSVKEMMPWDLRHLVLRNPGKAQPAEPQLPAKPG
ncbi:hypothetical protein AAEX63_10725 [Luteococcus sp. H138]|uniref:hypothetical protein n=1 Tax=unclassified Luteococcus TaxID=2639923 RepID=UPI00313ADC32